MSPAAEDHDHEIKIKVELQAMIDALEDGRKAEARARFSAARQLISARSPATIARLERERGLAERSA